MWHVLYIEIHLVASFENCQIKIDICLECLTGMIHAVENLTAWELLSSAKSK